MNDYCSVFGVRAAALANIIAINNQGSLLQNVLGLKHLQLHFPSPYLDGQTPVCQRTAVDWIMHFEFRFVKDIPNVYLEGCVKATTTEK